MAGHLCPHCGQSMSLVGDGPGTLGRCSTCNLSFALQEQVGNPVPSPEKAGHDTAHQAGLSSLLELPSLQRSLENDEAARRTRAIHRAFWRVTVGIWLVGFVGCVNLMSEGKGDGGFGVLVAGLFAGPVVGAFVAFFYAFFICPEEDVSGAEELSRRRREARRRAEKNQSAQSDGPTVDESHPLAAASQHNTEESEVTRFNYPPSSPDVGRADSANEEREQAAPPLDLSGLKRPIEKNNDAQLNRSVRRAFCLVGGLTFCTLVREGFWGAVFSGLGAGLVAAFLWAILISPWSDVSGAEELERKRKKARKAQHRTPRERSEDALPTAADSPAALPPGTPRTDVSRRSGPYHC